LTQLLSTINTTLSALHFLEVILDFQKLVFLAARSLSPIYFSLKRGAVRGCPGVGGSRAAAGSSRPRELWWG